MSKKKKVVISKSGCCPKCASKKLNFDNYEFHLDSVIFNYECKECGFLGYEEYSCKFIGHSDIYGNQFWWKGDKIDIEDTDNE